MNAGVYGSLAGSRPAKDYAPHILAKEGNHAIALLPRPAGGFSYALLRLRPVGGWALLGSDAFKRSVLEQLWRNECAFAEPLGWPDDPSFGLNLHRLISSSAFPADVSALAASAALALPRGLEWR